MWSNISTSSSPARVSGGDQLVCQEQDLNELASGKQQNDNVGCKRRYGSPLVRYKHAVCASQTTGYIYIHGGRIGNSPLDDDVWRFDPHHNSWIHLQTGGCKPPSLQEHTLVEYSDQLYLFGGRIGATGNESSFWSLDLANNQWRSLSMKSSSRYGVFLGPTNRRGHTAVLYGNSMYIYGGFEDFRGSSSQLWEYDLLNERWELRNLNATSSKHPEPRHNHSAIVYGDSMFVYGGLSNLKPLGDLWRWSWRERRWFRERTKGKAPGKLHGHTAIQAFGSMFVFGGERKGCSTRSLWRLNLSNMTWQKIRPKGPRPNPTTWHGAIANPLCILDEANYIIEGDAEMILKDVVPDGDSCSHVSASHDGKDQQTSSAAQQQTTALVHSKSSDVAESLAMGSIRNGPDRSSKQRKSRLSFLRQSRIHSERSKSIYELKQIRTSLSANNFHRRNDKHFASSQNDRHSVTLIKKETATCDHHSAAAAGKTISMDCESPETNNVGILDSLDTDIKEMFQRALSPRSSQQVSPRADEPEVPMQVDTSSRSHYVTAPIAEQRNSQTFFSSSNQLRSQRTSCAYTTPPSEMNTLRDESSQEITDRTLSESGKPLARFEDSRALLASTPSGYDKRDNRPRSEIVQSLIDRADARIKHLYTPYFNNHRPSDKLSVRRRADGKQQSVESSKRGQSFLDKSKRHTIHQTMTYYNLYYNSEESSKSSSGGSGHGNHDSSNSPKEVPDGRLEELRDIDDFGSSSTMKGVNSGSAILVGVHQDQQASSSKLLAESQQADQVSLNATSSRTQSSSDTGTLCMNSSQFQVTSDRDQVNQSSFQSALTVRPDTSAESCDNTSLSFSVIAEFEEDDMLQFSSPVTVQNNNKTSRHLADSSNSFRAAQTVTNRVETVLMREPEDHLQTVTLTDCNSSLSQVHRPDGHEQVDSSGGGGGGGLTFQNKSTSSGYDSIASRGQDTPSQEANIQDPSSCRLNCELHKGSNSRTFESVSSSLGGGGLSSSTTIDTTTSPEESAMKKLRARCQVICSSGSGGHQQQQPPPRTSVRSADSLATVAGESLSDMANNSPQKDNTQVQTAAQTTTLQAELAQRKLPLISRPRFFGRSSSKSRYWQLCMFVIGGKQTQGNQG